MITVDVLSEPTGQAYKRLVSFAQRKCATFLLVERTDVLPPMGARARLLIASLTPYLVAEGESAEWPGTKISRPTAKVREYSLNDVSAHILRTAADGLYAWLTPNLPEDLCFLRADRTPWLVSVAHESEGSLFFKGAEELTELRLECDQLNLHLREEGYCGE